MIFCRCKVRKVEDITIYDAPIERVDSFCYLGIVFRYMIPPKMRSNNIDKARKVVFKINVLLNEVNLDVKTRIHLFVTLMLPVLLYYYMFVNCGVLKMPKQLKSFIANIQGTYFRYGKAHQMHWCMENKDATN